MGQSPLYKDYTQPGVPPSEARNGVVGYTNLAYGRAKQALFRSHPTGRYGTFLVLMHVVYNFMGFSAFSELVRKPFLPVAGWLWLTFGLAAAHLGPGLMGLMARVDKDKRTYSTLAQHHAPFLQHAILTNFTLIVLTVAFFVFKYTTDNLTRFDEARYKDTVFVTTELHKLVFWDHIMIFTVMGFLISTFTGSAVWQAMSHPRQRSLDNNAEL